MFLACFLFLYLFFFVIFVLKDVLFIKTFISPKIFIFLDKIRLFSTWDLFIGMGPMYYDIKITALSNKKTYTWYLRDTKNIGDTVINSGASRLTICFYYKQYFSFFLNNYFLENITKYLKNKSEELIYFKIEEIWYDSYSSNEINNRSNLIFDSKLK